MLTETIRARAHPVRGPSWSAVCRVSNNRKQLTIEHIEVFFLGLERLQHKTNGKGSEDLNVSLRLRLKSEKA